MSNLNNVDITQVVHEILLNKEHTAWLQKLELLFSLLNLTIFLKDVNLSYQYCSPSFLKLFDYSNMDCIRGKLDPQIFNLEIANTLMRDDHAVLDKNININREVCLKISNKTRSFLMKKIPLSNQEHQLVGILGYLIDMEDFSYAFEQQYSHIISSLPGSLYWKDQSGAYLGCNKFVAVLAGFSSPEDLVGKTDFDLCWADQASAVKANDQLVMSTGNELIFEEKVTLFNGEIIDVLTKKVPLQDLDGNIIGVIGNSQDITERKKLEDRLRETTAREQSLKALSSLGGMIAHELRSPLLSLSAGLSSIKKWFPELLDAYKKWYDLSDETPPIQPGKFLNLEKAMDAMDFSVLHAQATIRNVLNVFHQLQLDKAILKPLDLLPLVENTLKSYPLEEDEKKLIKLGFLEYSVIGDEHLIGLVICNLLKNALHAIKEVDKGEILIWSEFMNGDVLLHFKDTASGIPPDVYDKIFEPFFTTKKEVAASIGIGLFFCKICLERMNGKISCNTQYNHYTHFTLKLRAA